MYKTIVNVLKITRQIIQENVKEEDIVVDFTLGNGNDTLQLAKALNKTGKIYGFDIQNLAIENTRKKLSEELLLYDNIELIKDGHEKVGNYITGNIDFGIYNLGYLPSGDKSVITKSKSTLQSLKVALDLLNPNGIIVVVSYIGHPGGQEENDTILGYLKTLNQKEFNVLKQEFVNQINNPPKVYVIEKSK